MQELFDFLITINAKFKFSIDNDMNIIKLQQIIFFLLQYSAKQIIRFFVIPYFDIIVLSFQLLLEKMRKHSITILLSLQLIPFNLKV